MASPGAGRPRPIGRRTEHVELFIILLVAVPFILPIIALISQAGVRARLRQVEEILAAQQNTIEALSRRLKEIKTPTVAVPAAAAAEKPAPSAAPTKPVEPPKAVEPPKPVEPPPVVVQAPPPVVAPVVAPPPVTPPPRPLRPVVEEPPPV